MSYTNSSNDPEQSRSAKSPSLPDGYRSGVITAITVLLGFSFLFLRSWAFELPGEWTTASVIAGILLAVAILLELVALWRALQLKDNDAGEYGLTLRWFLVSILTLLLSLLIAALSYAHAS